MSRFRGVDIVVGGGGDSGDVVRRIGYRYNTKLRRNKKKKDYVINTIRELFLNGQLFANEKNDFLPPSTGYNTSMYSFL